LKKKNFEKKNSANFSPPRFDVETRNIDQFKEMVNVNATAAIKQLNQDLEHMVRAKAGPAWVFFGDHWSTVQESW
jgi:hypothetical protein